MKQEIENLKKEIPKLNTSGRYKRILLLHFTEKEIKDNLYLSQGEIKVKSSFVDKVFDTVKIYYVIETKNNAWIDKRWIGTIDYFHRYHDEWLLRRILTTEYDLEIKIPITTPYNLQNIMNIMSSKKADDKLISYSIRGNSLIKNYELKPLKAYAFDDRKAFICLESKTKTYKFYEVSVGLCANIGAKKFLKGINTFKQITKDKLDRLPDVINGLNMLNEMTHSKWDKRKIEAVSLIIERFSFEKRTIHLLEELIPIIEKQAVLEEVQT